MSIVYHLHKKFLGEINILLSQLPLSAMSLLRELAAVVFVRGGSSDHILLGSVRAHPPCRYPGK